MKKHIQKTILIISIIFLSITIANTNITKTVNQEHMNEYLAKIEILINGEKVYEAYDPPTDNFYKLIYYILSSGASNEFKTLTGSTCGLYANNGIGQIALITEDFTYARTNYALPSNSIRVNIQDSEITDDGKLYFVTSYKTNETITLYGVALVGKPCSGSNGYALFFEDKLDSPISVSANQTIQVKYIINSPFG